MLEIKDDALNGAKSPLSLEVSLCLERGLNGKWEIKCSNIKEVGYFGVGPTQAVFRPNALAEAFPLNPPHVHKFKPKPTLVWQPKRKELTTRSFSMQETQIPRMSSSYPCERLNRSSLCPLIMPLMSLMVSDVAAAQFLNSDKIIEARYELSVPIDPNQVSDVVESELLGSNESVEARNGSTCTTDSDERLVRDLRLILQEHFGNIVQKWGNSEQWVLELCDGRRVVVLFQISLTRCEATEVLEKQQQLALVVLESSDVTNVSSALIEEDEILVEDGVSDTYSEEADQPLVVDPIAFSLPLAMAEQ